MLGILIAHGIAAAVAPVLVSRWGRLAFLSPGAGPGGVCCVGGAELAARRAGTGIGHPWVPELSMNITLRFDSLAAIMSVLVLGIGALVLLYCAPLPPP